MRYICSILMLLLTTILLACQPAESVTISSQGAATQSSSPGSSPVSSATQTSVPLSTPEATDMTPATPLDASAQTMVKLATQHLAQKLGIAAAQIVLSEVKPVVWRDAGLGCPKPGVDYIQMETPGYNIFLEAGGKTYNYHTDESKRFVLCSR